MQRWWLAIGFRRRSIRRRKAGLLGRVGASEKVKGPRPLGFMNGVEGQASAR